MRLGKSITCFALAGILILGYMIFIDTSASQVAQTNVTGTAFETQYNGFNSLISHSTAIIMFVALLFGGAGIFFAISELKSGRGRGRRW